jgi:hypothetical protein
MSAETKATERPMTDEELIDAMAMTRWGWIAIAAQIVEAHEITPTELRRALKARYEVLKDGKPGPEKRRRAIVQAAWLTDIRRMKEVRR